MLKGYQKRLIMMPTRESQLFESAYFILRKDSHPKSPTKNEMLSEATRILEENALGPDKPRFTRLHLAAALLAGLLLGALAVGIVWICVA
ncbi:MAG: hypothetical protein IKV00_10175 [Clostridia bacterium]|nr:hypothetical protein [Clostridia bacterium]